MSTENAPLIYVDLVEDLPDTLELYAEVHGLALTEDTRAAYQTYRDRFQPWRIVVRSGGNFEALFRSTESYFNEADAKHAAQLAFGSRSNVYLRQKEEGNVVLRLASRASAGLIARAKAALDGITAGPWLHQIAPSTDSTETPAEFLAKTLIGDGEPLHVLTSTSPDAEFAYVVPAVTGDGPTSAKNADFISAARELLPELLAEVERIQSTATS